MSFNDIMASLKRGEFSEGFGKKIIQIVHKYLMIKKLRNPLKRESTFAWDDEDRREIVNDFLVNKLCIESNLKYMMNSETEEEFDGYIIFAFKQYLSEKNKKKNPEETKLVEKTKRVLMCNDNIFLPIDKSKKKNKSKYAKDLYWTNRVDELPVNNDELTDNIFEILKENKNELSLSEILIQLKKRYNVDLGVETEIDEITTFDINSKIDIDNIEAGNEVKDLADKVIDSLSESELKILSVKLLDPKKTFKEIEAVTGIKFRSVHDSLRRKINIKLNRIMEKYSLDTGDIKKVFKYLKDFLENS